ncbi:glycoside hydrolase family 16 protein [Marinoscillum furvescens]|uniref:GH16 domain-containing protein n=1 Tax=Marinoscillum furvescens DSM 4134 TaxID=1122208 RepID=A0A3D9LKT2_MARFU|nr:glycoside hydrolase family 16 protein [Marinoscillum furvescens]REE05872.1 hypothetical protein C7460_101391 [Marinoscillum furvescens DSM 4134]
MKKTLRTSGIKLLVLITLTFSGCSEGHTANDTPPEPESQTRIIEFSGYEWVVRNSNNETVGPGPNYFSDSEENVWVDDKGRLHLKIVQQGGIWYCSAISLRRSLGYNKYVFYVGSRVDQLDQNVVGGLFTYMNDYEEIDIEFSRWSDPDNQDAQFAVQPSHESGNKTRFDLAITDSLTTHYFDWQPDKIDFASYRGHTLEPADSSAIISSWNYTGNSVPPDSEERLKINLWLFRGRMPSNLQEQEMIIDRVEIY